MKMHAETCQKHYLRCDWLKLCSFSRDCAKLKDSLTYFLSLFALWLVQIILIFMPLCRSNPHQMHFSRLVHFLKRKILIWFASLVYFFYEIFMWYYWRDCDTCSLFDCAKLPLKCIFCVVTRVTFVFEKMVGVFSMTALAVICVCIIFHTQLFLIQETLFL